MLYNSFFSYKCHSPDNNFELRISHLKLKLYTVKMVKYFFKTNKLLCFKREPRHYKKYFGPICIFQYHSKIPCTY